MNKISRREMLKASGAMIAATSLSGVNAFASESFLLSNTESAAGSSAKTILIIGAHPDDPETGCGGTMIKLAGAGHKVISVYFTRGERGIAGKGLDESAKIRTTEAENACRILGAKPVFMSQTDGDTRIEPHSYLQMKQLIESYKPDAVFTHWPIDGHRDHRNCSSLVFDVWRNSENPFELYYFEVCTGRQTMHFFPTDFVDITDVVKQKREACFCHVSQQIQTSYKEEHGRMEEFRGMQCGAEYAEGFVKFHKSIAKGSILDVR